MQQHRWSRSSSSVLGVLLALWLAGCRALPAASIPPLDLPATLPDASGYRRLAEQIDRYFHDGHLALWYPRCIDTQRGGFHQRFAEDWKPLPEDSRFIVFQSRMTWLAAAACLHDPQLKDRYAAITRHGIDYLDKVLRDREQGGLFWTVDLAGNPTGPHGAEKHAYGLSFAIYAGATAYAATDDLKALGLAWDTFLWLEKHAHDAVNGGYYEALSRDGKPILTPPTRTPATPRDQLGTPYGYKSMNSHIHLLEAFTALHHVKRDPLVKQRLEEMLKLVRDRIAVEPGCLNYYFTPDWKPVPMHDSFGHDIETAFLLVEAAEALGGLDDQEKTWGMARKLVDHALEYGFDEKRGGFYEAGPAFGAACDRGKGWWTQAEGLNALLLMHQRYGKESDRYWRAFVKQLRWVWERQIDHRYGGWWGKLSEEGEVEGGRDKATMWKAAYHDGRALMQVSRRLREMGR